MHAKVANKKRVIGRNGTSSHNGGNYRDAGFFYNLKENIIGTGNIDTSAGKEKRLLCLGQGFKCSFKLSDVNTGIRLIAADINILRVLRRL